ncbi:hypothetical protein FYJ38_24515 [Clostridium sp. WB02_MRS01]|uniref:type II toxin-antitoxin system RnlB family antitoxin n=1 Tax=Clostridium sp. WB02_MRS01 TaxID=2605777 RepID=UPI0012B38081|nr:type II toxin-antitoxin system RnlB family antitoxin [Clostridium sp. WB02_MRS01]MSS11774.1 hypothetical protein [Clostridium sp. WB02_MRS01]
MTIKYQVLNIDPMTLLIVPTDQEAPLSEVVEQFNSYNKLDEAVAIIDLLIYVGNKRKRFKQFPIIGGKISMQTAKDCIPTENLVNLSYDIFSEMPDIVISQIISPRIRNEIYERKNRKVREELGVQ